MQLEAQADYPGTQLAQALPVAKSSIGLTATLTSAHQAPLIHRPETHIGSIQGLHAPLPIVQQQLLQVL